MREFSLPISLKEGLRKYDDQPAGNKGLVDCLNAVPKERGLVKYSKVNNPFTAALTYDWPFPQLFRGKGLTLLADNTAIYTVTETGDNSWTKAQITTKDYADVSSGKAITSGESWHFIDFYDVWMMFNTNCVVFKTERYNILGTTDYTLVQNDVTVNTGCSFKGRALLGGFNVADFRTSAWTAFWNKWGRSELIQSETIDSNFVMWTNIGGGDLLWLFYADLAESGLITDNYHDATKPLFFDEMKKNQRGFMPMPWQGTVNCLLPVEDAVVVYGTGGVSALIPYVEPIPTFGLKDILRVGIAGRSAVASNGKEHVFVDARGTLWHIDGKLQLRKLGYKEYFKPMLETDIVGTYDPVEEEFRLSNSEFGYVLSEGGLSRTNQLVNSCRNVGSKLQGVFQTSGEDKVEVISEAFDMNLQGIKTVTFVEIDNVRDTSMQVAIEYKFNTGEDYRRSSFRRVNDFGTVRMQQSGIDFRLVIRANPSDKMRLENATVKWQMSDKRFVRSAYVNSTNRGAGG